jgi:hypothetical protein
LGRQGLFLRSWHENWAIQRNIPLDWWVACYGDGCFRIPAGYDHHQF